MPNKVIFVRKYLEIVMSIFKIGCDPEFFVRNKASGEFVSGFGLVPGTKSKPHKVKNGAVQVDGLLLEINIDPAESAEEFLHNIESVKSQLEAMIPDHELVTIPSVHFKESVLKGLPKEALELGCDPEFCAYKEVAIEKDLDNLEPNFRTAGGHIHIGWCEGVDTNHPDHIKACTLLAKELDYFLGMTSLLWDEDYERRSLYGAPGSMRVKSYGVEYRTLSNLWLQSPELIKWVFETTVYAAELLSQGESYAKSYGQNAKIIISECTKPLSIHRKKFIENMCSRSGIGFPPGFESNTILP